MRAKPFVPDALWRGARDWFWRNYWRREREFETERLGAPAPDLSLGERAALIKRISDHCPFDSVLEIGCSVGQNFHFLGRLFPDSRFVGLDRNAAAIEQGQVLLREAGITNTTLIAGEGENISFIPDASFDLVFSSAFFLYIRPESAPAIAYEMMRIARRKVLLLEQHYERGPDGRGDLYVPRMVTEEGGYWLRDYRVLFEEIAPGCPITFTKIPQALWQGEQWQTHGYLIEIEKN